MRGGSSDRERPSSLAHLLRPMVALGTVAGLQEWHLWHGAYVEFRTYRDYDAEISRSVTKVRSSVSWVRRDG